MPVDAKASDLPHIPDDETWYRYVCSLCIRGEKVRFLLIIPYDADR